MPIVRNYISPWLTQRALDRLEAMRHWHRTPRWHWRYWFAGQAWRRLTFPTGYHHEPEEWVYQTTRQRALHALEQMCAPHEGSATYGGRRARI